MKYLVKLLIALFITSCTTVSPNYNKYSTHNESTEGRMKEVMKQDSRSKRQIKSVRKRTSRSKHTHKKPRIKRRYV